MIGFWSLPVPALLAAAEARQRSLVFRASNNAIFAASVAFTTGLLVAPLVAYAIILAMMLADVWTGRSIAGLSEVTQAKFKWVLVATAVAAISAAMGLGVIAMLYGGGEGRLTALLIAVSSLVTVVVLIVDAPAFMVLCCVPALVVLILLALTTAGSNPTLASQLEVGLWLSLGAFVNSLIRAAHQHLELFGLLSGARADAERRRLEAETRRADAERARAEAERANRAKSDFLHAMSHELRTPLNAVINYAEMIEEAGDPVTIEDAGRIVQSGRHLLDLVSRVLEFADLQEGRLALNWEVADARDLVECALVAHGREIEARGNHILFDHPTKGCLVHVDRERAQECLEEILRNASSHTSGGAISIAVTDIGEACEIAITDSGSGFPVAASEAIFEPFAQLDGSRTRTKEGLGLGLASARNLARAMAGDITAASEPGKGATFVLTLPKSSTSAAHQRMAIILPPRPGAN